jgi:uncharacterized protein
MQGSQLAFSLLAAHIPADTLTYAIYVPHVTLVTNLALRLARKHGFTQEEQLFLEEAGLLHDIGITLVNDPELGCFGDAAYIEHGVLGAKILRSHGLEKHALVAERHTGVGLTKQDIISQSLPLPHQDYVPLSRTEVLLCYADLFFSKTPHKLWEMKTPPQVRASLERFGPEKVRVFDQWSAEYGL